MARASRSKGVRTLSPWGSYHALPADAVVPYPVAQSLQDRTQFLYLRPCPVCREAKPMYAYRRTCSNACKGVLLAVTRSSDHIAKARAVANRNLAEAGELRDMQRIQAEALSPVEAYRLGLRRSYRRAYLVGVRAERRRWEEA